LCAYLEAHPELLTADLEPILLKQWERQEEATRDLLTRMCVLRVPIDIEGLTFLRLYEEDLTPQPPSLRGNGELESPSPRRGGVGEGSTQAEVQRTQTLINRLVDCQLVRRRFDKTPGKHFYDLHRVIADFAQNQCGERLPELMRSVYSFYQARAEVENPKTLEELRPMLEAQHFAFQLGNYGEAENLIYQLEEYLEPWGYWGLLLELCEQIVDKLDEASQPCILQRIGSRHRDWGDWNEAERYYRQSLQMCEELGDRSGMASSWSLLGDIKRNRGNWDAAEQLYRQCLQLFEELGDRAGVAATWGRLGDIESNRGNWDNAEQLYRQCLQIEEELGDRSGVAAIWGRLGDIESNRGNWGNAEQLYRQSLQLREELGDRSGMASSWGQLGNIERNRGNWDNAEQLYRQYQQMCEELGNRSGMATSWGCLGENELGRGNLDKAEELLTQALTKMQELSMTYSIAEINWDLAQLYRQRNTLELAQHHYETAHQLFTQLGAKKDIERIEREWDNLGD
jgi:tetratricopeptide (TPR) repeat protein